MVANKETGSSRQRRDLGRWGVGCPCCSYLNVPGWWGFPTLPSLALALALDFMVILLRVVHLPRGYLGVFIIALVFEGSSIYLCFFHSPWVISFTLCLPQSRALCTVQLLQHPDCHTLGKAVEGETEGRGMFSCLVSSTWLLGPLGAASAPRGNIPPVSPPSIVEELKSPSH